MEKVKKFKFSGHETFAFRYAWLPKAYQAVKANSDIFADEDLAMIELGVGKNMVKSIRFWATLLGIVESDGGRALRVTPFGTNILDPREGFDPYLEDSQTMWLLHWRLSTAPEPLFVWDYLLNRWQESEMVASIIIPMIIRELEGKQNLSRNSIDSLLKVFFHTYVPTRGKKSKVVEDNLDCPLVQLRLIEYAGERDCPGGKNEAIYTFRRGEKPEVSQSLFLYCLADYWEKVEKDEKTLSFGQIAHGLGSPGQILKLSEGDIQERLIRLTKAKKYFIYTDSSTSCFLERKFDGFAPVLKNLLRGVYK